MAAALSSPFLFSICVCSSWYFAESIVKLRSVIVSLDLSSYILANKLSKGCCSGHNIRADVVEQLLIRQINSVMEYVSEYEDEFIRQVMERGTAEQLKQANSLKKTVDATKRRIEQIDSVISQLYEDKVVGEITAEMFTKLSAKYITEQEEQNAALKSAQKELAAFEAKKTDTTKFIDLVRKYPQITELTPQILNEFIDKVTVHQAIKVDRKRRQDIEVYF